MAELAEELAAELGDGSSGGKIKPGERRNENGRRGKPKPEEPDGLDDAARMRRVWEQPKERDCNTPQRHLRRILEKDRAKYLQIMTGLEKGRGGVEVGGESSAAVPDLPPDEGEARVRRLKGELLERADAGYRAWKESRRRGAGPPPS